MNENKINIVEETKELLSDPRNRIKLDDFVTEYLKMFIEKTNIKNFPVESSNFEMDKFLDRMKRYEEVVKDLQQIVILIAKWGESEQLFTLEKIFTRIAETNKELSISNTWTNFRWYPIQILMYSAGIAALSAVKYESLKRILTTNVEDSFRREHLPLVVPATSKIISGFHDTFKKVPGWEKKFVPISEHLFEILKPIFEELLFLGENYEKHFDNFEIFSSLIYINMTGRDWGPIGRFGWKQSRDRENSPFNQIIKEANDEKENWLPLKADLFRGSLQEFEEAVKVLGGIVQKLHWF